MCYEVAALYAALSQEDKARIDALIRKLLEAQRGKEVGSYDA